jgi:ABC-type uncharacterized transport system ATPase subunit
MTIEANEIAARGLTKHYGRARAVDDLSFTVRTGQVTGFLGPNGAGKSTTMRMILGLDRPTSGVVTVGGTPFTAIHRPLHRLVRYWRYARSTVDAAPITTSSAWHRATASQLAESPTSST